MFLPLRKTLASVITAAAVFVALSLAPHARAQEAKSRINVSIPTPSSDGKYHGRFPHGDAPPTANPIAGAATDSTSASGSLGASGSVPNLAALSAVFPGPDTAGYIALNIPGQAAGFQWNDTVTGVKTTKLTSATVPTSGQWGNWYSSMGLAISLPFGPNLDQYHIAILSVSAGTSYLCDFGLQGSATPGPYNYRPLPAAFLNYSAGTAAFSRKHSQIMYVLASGAKLRLYDVVAGAFVDSSAASLGYSASWPSTGWPWNAGFNQWFMVNAQETWATGNNSASSGDTAYSLNLTNGTASTQVGAARSVDDTYSGYGAPTSDPVYSGDGSITSQYSFDLATSTKISTSPAITGSNWDGSNSFHMPSMNGYWVTFGSQLGGGHMQMMKIFADGSNNANSAVFWPKFYGQFHNSGHWWNQGSGTAQWMVMSTDNAIGDSGWTQTEKYAISFVSPDTGATRRLGFHYSWSGESGGNMAAGGPASGPGGASQYFSQAHATISHDGKLVLFSSNMLNQARTDAFVMEVPLTSGTPAAFP